MCVCVLGGGGDNGVPPPQLSGLKWWKNDEINQKQKKRETIFIVYLFDSLMFIHVHL